MGPIESPQANAGPPSTPTHGGDGSDSSQVRRSPRCKEARTPYYLPLSEQPVNDSTPGRGVGVPDSCSPNVAARKGSRTAPAQKRGRAETPEASFRCPELPSSSQHGAQRKRAASTLQQPRAGNARGQGTEKRGGRAQADRSLVMFLPEDPDQEVRASGGRSAPRGVTISPSRSLAGPSGSESESEAAGSQSTAGRQRRATAAAAMLRLKGKMKPPDGSEMYNNMSVKEVIATVSAAVSAAQSHSQQPSQGVKEEPSCATSGPAKAKSRTARATRSTTSATKTSAGRKRQLAGVTEDPTATQPDPKRVAVEGGPSSECKAQDVGGKTRAGVAAGTSGTKVQSSAAHRQGGPSVKRELAQLQAGKPREGAARKERSAKELVQAVAKGAGAGPSTAAPPQRGRAAAKLKQEDARATAAKGKLVPAAVRPCMQVRCR